MAGTDQFDVSTLNSFPASPVVPAATIRAVVKIAPGTPDPSRTVVSSVNPNSTPGA
jgi:hypothetical protein